MGDFDFFIGDDEIYNATKAEPEGFHYTSLWEGWESKYKRTTVLKNEQETFQLTLAISPASLSPSIMKTFAKYEEKSKK